MRKSSTVDVWDRFPGGQNTHTLINFDIMNFLLKTNDVRDRRPNFAIFLVWGASYVLAESLECKGSISHHSPSRKWGRWVSPWFHLVACVWCKSREMGSRGSPRFTNGKELLHRPSGHRKLLDWVAFRILSNISDGAPLWKYEGHL